MATPKKLQPPAMEATMQEYGETIRRFKENLTQVVMGEMSKLDEALSDLQSLWIGATDLVRGYVLPTMGEPEKVAEMKAELSAEIDQIAQMCAAEAVRFTEASAGGSLTEGSKVDRLLKLVEKLAPLLKLFLL